MKNNLIGKNIMHKQFGEGVITDINDNKFTIKFIPKEFQKKFTFNTVLNKKFFKDVSNEILDYAKKYIDLCDEYRPIKEIKLKERNKVKLYHYNEDGEEVTIQDLEEAKNYITDIWWYGNNCPAVVVDDELFINAKIACKLKGGQYVDAYDHCSGRTTTTKYVGCSWRFAKDEDLNDCIEELNAK